MSMTETELLTVLKSQLGDTIKYANDDFKRTNLDLDDAYRQEPYGNEEDDHSKVVSTDVYDSVESDMPSLARVFLGATDIMKFMPLNADDVEECEEKTKYANFLIRGQRESFKVNHDLLKEPGKALCSVGHYFVDEIEKAQYVSYTGLDGAELARVMEDLSTLHDATRVEIDRKTDNETEGEGEFDIRFKVVTETKKISVQTVPPESFIISRGAACKNTAALVGHESRKSKGSLMAEGYPKEQVMDLPCWNDTSGDELRENRFRDKGGIDYGTGYHWTNEEVNIQTLFPLVDYDEDGIPERRMIVKVGSIIFENEPFDHVPYAIFSQILEPHSAIGLSRGQQAARTQLKKTAVERSLMDNIYAHGRPRLAVDDSDGTMDGGKVDLDDAMNHRIDGIVRTDGPPMNAIMPLVVPYIGNESLQVIQFMDAQKSVSLGNQMANQGLDADQFGKETATRFAGVEEAQEAKIELVSRVYAETGYRELYEGVIWLAQHFQDSATEIMVLGKPLTVDPTKWRYEHYCASQVGLGAGDTKESIANLGVTLNQQVSMIGSGSTVSDWSKVYNTLTDITKVMGKPDPNRYWNDPTQPDEVLQAQNDQMKQMIEQLQQELQTTGSLAQAESMKAQASVKNSTTSAMVSSEKNRNDYEISKLTLELKQKESQLDALKTLAEVRKLQADTKSTNVETGMVVSGLEQLVKELDEFEPESQAGDAL